MSISKGKCPGCLKPNSIGNTIVFGGRTWHKTCLEKLQASIKPPDKAMFQTLSRAFNKLVNEKRKEG